MAVSSDLGAFAVKAYRAWRRLPSPEVLSARFQTWNERQRAEAWWRTRPTFRRTPFNIVCLVVLVVGVANFFAFVVGSILIGGDALNGRIVGGQFLLSDHGHLHEVSESVFRYSLWHARSFFFVTHPLAMLCGWLLHRDACTSSSRSE